MIAYAPIGTCNIVGPFSVTCCLTWFMWKGNLYSHLITLEEVYTTNVDSFVIDNSGSLHSVS